MGPTKMIAQLGLVLVGLTIFSGRRLGGRNCAKQDGQIGHRENRAGVPIENPEVIEEAIQILRARRQAEEENRAKQALSQNGDALRHHPMTPVSGNVDGDVTVVEFFDYQCGYCKRSLASMVELLRSDKNVRVVWKELPILGPASCIAARAAMASKKQAKYLDFHIALMGERGRLSEGKIMEAAKRVGLNLEKLREDMKDPAIDAYLDETQQLANALGIRGTPAFVIGDTLVPGAIDTAGHETYYRTIPSGRLKYPSIFSTPFGASLRLIEGHVRR